MGKTQKIRTQADPTYSPHRIRNQNRKRKNAFKRHRKSFWKPQQEKLYVQYLQENRFQFEDPLERKQKKVFMHMTHFIKIRGPDQCRSHHQKMLKKYGTVANIVEGIKQNKLLQELIKQQDVLKQEDSQAANKYIQLSQSQCFSQSQKNTQEEPICQKVEIIQKHANFQQQIWDILDSRALINDQKLFC